MFFVFFFPRKLYVLLSVLLCLLLSGLGGFFLFPHSVLVDDDGIKVVQVWFDRKNSAVLLAITVNFLRIRENKSPREPSQRGQGCLCPLQATLRIRNSNFYSVTVSSLSSQVQYMNTVVGSQQLTNVSSIQPLRDKLVLTGSCGGCTRHFSVQLGPLPPQMGLTGD